MISKIISGLIGATLSTLFYHYVYERWWYYRGYWTHEGWCKIVGHKKPPANMAWEHYHSFTCTRCYHVVDNTKNRCICLEMEKGFGVWKCPVHGTRTNQ